jgi:putative hydrolase of the HAD superfamily
MAEPRVEAIIFDCFGVLTTDGWLPYKRKYFGEEGELYEQATELNHKVDAGLITYNDFIDGVAKLAGLSSEEARRQIEDNAADDRLFDYVRDNLHGRYKLGMLSNAAQNWMDELFKPEQVALFDTIAISSEIGVIKPDERAYLITAEKLGVKPEECVFIDDQEWYVVAARNVGMKGIHYTGFKRMVEDLESLLK